MAMTNPPEWVYDVLRDLSIFAAQNNRDITKEAVEIAMARVNADAGRDSHSFHPR